MSALFIISQQLSNIFMLRALLEPRNMHIISAKICPIFNSWTPTGTHFMHFWMMSSPNQPGLKWKSATCIGYEGAHSPPAERPLFQPALLTDSIGILRHSDQAPAVVASCRAALSLTS